MENIQTNMMTKTDKIKAMERESNITLISTAVAIVSFFLLLYAQNLTKTNTIASQKFLTIVEWVYFVAAIGTGALAIIKRKLWLCEYTVFCLAMLLGYYLMKNGVAGIPFMIKEGKDTFTVTPLAVKLAKIIRTDYITYGLWALNVIYCVLAIALHSVKYNKIKKIKVDKTVK